MESGLRRRKNGITSERDNTANKVMHSAALCFHCQATVPHTNTPTHTLIHPYSHILIHLYSHTPTLLYKHTATHTHSPRAAEVQWASMKPELRPPLSVRKAGRKPSVLVISSARTCSAGEGKTSAPHTPC